jgi:ABC-type nitrate/sulfonate/bicarbonate transport system permease component
MLAGANLTRTAGGIVIGIVLGIVIGIVVGIARAGFARGEAVVIELASVVVAG